MGHTSSNDETEFFNGNIARVNILHLRTTSLTLPFLNKLYGYVGLVVTAIKVQQFSFYNTFYFKSFR